MNDFIVRKRAPKYELIEAPAVNVYKNRHWFNTEAFLCVPGSYHKSRPKAYFIPVHRINEVLPQIIGRIDLDHIPKKKKMKKYVPTHTICEVCGARKFTSECSVCLDDEWHELKKNYDG